MRFDRICTLTRPIYPGLLLCLVLGASILHAQDLRLSAPRAASYHPLDTDIRPGNPLADEAAILTLNTTLIRQKQEIDFEQRQITFKQVDELGVVLWQYRYGELADYLRSRQEFVMADLWYKSVSDYQSDSQEQKEKRFALEFQLPVQYPSWAQRILGKDPPKLTIHGYEEISIKYNVYDRREEGVNLGNTTRSAPTIENNYSLSVEGSVGRLISVSMRTTSEEQFALENPLKDIKLQYKGEGNELEDEIIQEVTAGYTHFSLPGATFAGYSESREGLFGISVKSKFGPLMLTTIASHEQGEALKQTFPLTASTSESAQRFHEKSFADHRVLYRFFFLDTLYRRAYNARNNFADPQDFTVPQVSRSLQVWRMIDKGQRQAIHSDPTGIYRADSSRDGAIFKRMMSGWEVNHTEGWIRFDDTVSIDNSTIIGLFMTTSDPTRVPTKGDTTIIDTSREFKLPRMRGLWILKPVESDMDTSSESYALMWRNVYKIDPIQGDFSVVVRRINAAGGDADSLKSKRNTDTLYSYLLGLTDFKGSPVGNDRIFDTERGYLILPPFSADYRGNEPFRNPTLGSDNVNPRIYELRHTLDDFHKEQSKYLFEITGRHTSRRTTLQLGWGVIERSEKLVTNSGQSLTRDIDYRIVYETGEVQLISPRATSATSIDVEYQRESIFVPEKKVFLGARAELKLPGISETSLLGASILYQSTTSRDKVPRIGAEPFRKLLLDINTKLDFEPEWMTNLVNRIPLITTEAKSTVRVDLEVAHSRMTPTSQGQAYVDDFESSKESYQLFANHQNWYQGSPPFTGPGWDTLLQRPPAWKFYWFSPVHNDDAHWVNRYRDMMYPRDTSLYRNGVDTTHFTLRTEKAAEVLRLECVPAGPFVHEHYGNPWASIMTYLHEGSTDRSKDKYLEFYVKAEVKGTGRKGVLYLDLGQVSEDLCIQGLPPDGRLNDEDSAGLGRVQEFNRGLDRKWDQDEFYCIPNETRTGWDTLWLSDHRLARPYDPSFDNWKEYSTQNLGNFEFVNGTQGNGGYRGGRQLTSEDINGDGFSLTESFFRYRINLDSLEHSPFNVPEATLQNRNGANVRNNKGWYFVRIPLKEGVSDSVNKPSWQRIRYVRVWWSDFSRHTADTTNRVDTNQATGTINRSDPTLSDPRTLFLSDMEFVSNEWQEKATRVHPDTLFDGVKRFFGDSLSASPLVTDSITKIDASIISTVTDGDYQPHSSVVRERIQGARGITYKPEQSLRLRFHRIRSGEVALVRKRYTYQALDLSAYRTISLDVHSLENHVDDSLFFVFRFGTHDSSYYEYRTPIDRGWNKDYGAPIEIDLSFMASLKLKFLGDTSIKVIDTMVTAPPPNNSRARYRVYAQTNSPPNFAGIRTLMLGVVRGESNIPVEVSGELWINEMKVVGLQGFSGSAALARISTSWADFASVNASLDYRDGNFRTMTENRITPGNSRVSGGLDGSVGLDKFLPREWGVKVPVTASANMAIDRPQIVPNSDIPLHKNGEPDKLMDFINSTDTESRKYEQVSQTLTLGTSYRKSNNSENPLVNMTADRIAVEDLSANKNITTRARGERPDSAGQRYYETDTTHNYRTRVTYDLTPRKSPAWAKWRPFSQSRNSLLPSGLKNWEINLLPKKLNFELAEMQYTVSAVENQRYNTRFNNTTMMLGHEISVGYSPISPLLDFDYSLIMDRNLDRAVRNRTESWGDFLYNRVAGFDEDWGRYGFLYGESMRTQNFKTTLDPRLFDWLTHSADYTVRFRGDPQRLNDTTSYINLDVSTTFGFRTTLNFARLLNDLVRSMDSTGRMAATLETMKQGVETINFRDIRFSYSAGMILRNRNLYQDAQRPYMNDIGQGDFLLYQFGARSPWHILTGEMDDHQKFGMLYRKDRNHREIHYREDSRDVKRSWKTETGLRLPEPLDLDIRTLSLDYNKAYLVTPDETKRDTSTIFPDFNIRASTGLLNKIDIIQSNFSTLTLSTGYNYKLNTIKKITQYNQEHSIDTTREITHAFTPLVSTSGTFKTLPISFNYEHGFSISEADNTTASFSIRKVEHSDNLDMSYSIEPSSKRPEIKILWWSVPLKNNIETGLNANHRSIVETSIPRADDRGKTTITAQTRELMLTPRASYVFSDKVTGNTSIRWISKNQEWPTKRKETDFEFGLGVRISF